MALSNKPTDGNLLDFEMEIYLDMVQNDGLLLAARGIHFNEVLVNLLKTYCDPGNLVFVLNCSDFEVKYYLSRLLPNKHVHNITYTSTAKHRVDSYLMGGIYFVTNRILTVDMCKENVPIDKITGFIILKAHSVLGKGNEDWILRMFRQKNKVGFIKAFTNSAQACNRNLNDIERIMRILFVKNFQIWPRFHTLILPTLSRYAPEVIEYRVNMSPTLKKIQFALLDLMNMIVKEVKQNNPELEMSEITVENCLNRQCQKGMETQLDGVWNQLSHKTTQLFVELRTLSQIINYMLDEDPVTFYSIMFQYQKTTYVHQHIWPLLKPAEQLFEYVQLLVYTKDKDKELNPEPCLKWKTLSELLTQELVPRIERERNGKNKHILVLCKDAKACRQLSEVLQVGAQHYLFTKALQKGIRFNSVSKNFKCNAAATKEQRTNPLGCAADKYSKDKSPALGSKAEGDDDSNEPLNKSSYRLTMSQNYLDNECTLVLNSDDENTSFTFQEDRSKLPQTFFTTPTASTSKATATKVEDVALVEKEVPEDPSKQKKEPDFKANIVVQAFKHEHSDLSLTKTLEDLLPKFIVMYHHDVAAVRQIEVYSSRYRPDDRVQLFTLQYDGSVEEQSYLTALRKEKAAFEYLIEKKAAMVIPEYQDGKQEEVGLSEMIASASSAVNTRHGGASTSQADAATKKRLVIVDMREFRSELPGFVHKLGFEVKPLMMKVGDYILTPEIIVERKTVSDLIGSLSSGRLYEQCTQMFRYYAKPILLIEFDFDKPMRFELYKDSKREGDNFDVKKKLVLLTMHFPKLVIMYCHGAMAAAQYFAELKEGKEEPSEEQAANEDLRLKESNDDPAVYDFVSKLPGITSKNVNSFMQKGKNMEGVIKMSREQLTEMLGNSAEAETLYDALHKDYNPLTEAEPQGKKRAKFKYTGESKKIKETEG